jgi:aryl-alcohol dehydrogenase-like predicted oxidoreductase
MGKVDKAEAIATVRTAIDNGITLIDTAQFYRDSESILGDALADGYRD